MEEFPEDVLTNLFSYLDSGQSKKVLSELSLQVQATMSKYANDNNYWKKKVETMIGAYIESTIVRDWRRVYEYIFDVKPHLMSRAAEQGYTEIVQLLLLDLKIDPNVGMMMEPLHVAIVNGYIDIVKLLLSDKRVIILNEALLIAVNTGHADIVQLLLSNPDYKINPAYMTNSAVIAAAGLPTVAILELLLHTDGVNPAANNNEPIIQAATKGITGSVKLLLADKRVSPQASGNYAIRVAAYEGHLDVVKLLLADPRVNPASLNNEAIRFAAANNHVDIVELLLLDPRVNPSANDDEALKSAFHNRQDEMLMLLLGSPKISLPFKRMLTYKPIIKIINEYHTMPLSVLMNMVDDPSTNWDILSVLKSKYFWWTRLELVHGVTSAEITTMDYSVNPMELCAMREQ